MHEAMQLLAFRYGLTGAAIRPLASTGGSLKNVYRVDAAGRSYVFKHYRPDFRTPQDVAFIYEAQAYLAERGLPVVAAIPDRAGLLTTPIDGGCWVLYPWADGHHPVPGQISVAEAAVLGETLGQLDLCLASWPTDWAGAEPFEAYPAEDRMALCEELLRHAERGSGALDAACVQSLRFRLGALERLSAVAPGVIAMERQWVHGDPNEGNILFADGEDRIAAFIDFDNIRRAPRGFDFMYCLDRCFPSPGPDRDAYARAYLRTVRPTDAELELYVPMWAYRGVCDLWPIDVVCLRPAEYQPAWRIYQPSDRWERECQTTTEWLWRLNASAGE